MEHGHTYGPPLYTRGAYIHEHDTTPVFLLDIPVERLEDMLGDVWGRTEALEESITNGDPNINHDLVVPTLQAYNMKIRLLSDAIHLLTDHP